MEDLNIHNHDYDRDDDDHDHEQGGERTSGIGGSRWNPTKEQIEMLERMYSTEGVRTPSAEQIQQITARLRVYGNIEGKNVFYWFQNHKARQRQKQRHERLIANANANANNHVNGNANFGVNHVSRMVFPTNYQNYHGNYGVNLNARPSILPSSNVNYHYSYLPNPNVICNPYYRLPQPHQVVYNPPHHHYSTPAAVGDHDHQEMKKRSSKPIISKAMSNQNMLRGGDRVGMVPHGSRTLSGYCAAMMNNSKSINNHDHYDHDHYVGDSMSMRTLDLFPVHPTGILEHKLSGNIGCGNNSSAVNSCATSYSSDANVIDDHGDDLNHDYQQLQFFNFISNGHA